jgi:hypothetical protein
MYTAYPLQVLYKKKNFASVFCYVCTTKAELVNKLHAVMYASYSSRLRYSKTLSADEIL